MSAERAKTGAKTVEEAYNILGLPQNAPQCDVKQAYKKMALRHHPDKNPGNAEAHKQFILISEAFQRISRSKHSQHSKQKYQDQRRSDDGHNYNVDEDDDDDEGSDDGSDYDDDDDYYDDDDDGSDDDMFSGRGDTMFEEMFRRMFFEGRGIRGRGGPSFSFNFGRRCDCPECRNQFRPKTPKMSEQEIAQARQDRKERNMRTKAQREAEAESARLEKERIEREKREKIAEEKEAAVQRIAERKDVPNEVNKVVEALKDHLAKCKADKNDEASFTDLSASVSAAQGLLQEKTSDGSNLVTVTIGRDKLNTSMKKATAYLAALAKEEEEERERENAVNIERENREREDAERKEREEAENREKELLEKEEKEKEKQKEKEDLEKKKAASKVSADVNTKSDATSNQQTEAKKEKEKPLSKKAQKKLELLNAAKSTAAAAAHMKSATQTPSPPQTVKYTPTVVPSKMNALPGSATSGQKSQIKFSPTPITVPSGKGNGSSNVSGRASNIQEQQRLASQQKFSNKPISKADITSTARESSYDLTVSNLIQMGFEMKDSQEAVNKYGNDFDAAVSYLVQKKGSKKEIPPYQQQQQQQQQQYMYSGYTNPSVPSVPVTGAATGGGMYSSKVGMERKSAPGFGGNAPGFGKSNPTLPPPPPARPAALTTGAVPPSSPPQQAAAHSGVAMNVPNMPVKSANFALANDSQASSSPTSSLQQQSPGTLGGLEGSLNANGFSVTPSPSLPPGLQSMSSKIAQPPVVQSQPPDAPHGSLYTPNMWGSQVMPNPQSMAPTRDTQHQMQPPLAQPNNHYSPFSSSLQSDLLDQNMGGLSNGGLGGLGMGVGGGAQTNGPLQGLAAGLGGGLNVNDGFGESFNLGGSGPANLGGLLQPPSAPSTTSSKLPGLDGLGGLFGNSGNSGLNGNQLNNAQPQWQQSSPDLNMQGGNINALNVNIDKPAWW